MCHASCFLLLSLRRIHATVKQGDLHNAADLTHKESRNKPHRCESNVNFRRATSALVTAVGGELAKARRSSPYVKN